MIDEDAQAGWERAARDILIVAAQAVPHSPKVEQTLRDPVQAYAPLSVIRLARVGDCERDIGRAGAFYGSDASFVTGVAIPLDSAHSDLL